MALTTSTAQLPNLKSAIGAVESINLMARQSLRVIFLYRTFVIFFTLTCSLYPSPNVHAQGFEQSETIRDGGKITFLMSVAKRILISMYLGEATDTSATVPSCQKFDGIS